LTDRDFLDGRTDSGRNQPICKATIKAKFQAQRTSLCIAFDFSLNQW